MTVDATGPRPTRRGLLLGLAAAVAMGGRARLAFARMAGDARLVVVLLRGGLDGLFAVQPYGDPAHAGLRGVLALPEPGQEGGLRDLGGVFGLHPAMPALHGMYAAGEALVLHAVGGPWRTRSHFDAQDFLESGAPQERLSGSGWLNRALAAVPNPERARAGLSIGAGVPLLLRGATPVGSYAPAGLQPPPPDLLHRVAELQAADPLLGPAFAEGLRARGFAAEALGAPAEREGQTFPRLAAAAGRLLAAPEGPRVAAMELGGWDTHAGQIPRLVPQLRLLDAGLAALREGLGAAAWARTAVLAVTEFGRTVRPNGNLGTDHGTGGVAFVVGGAVAGGRVVADWPGLGGEGLLENRDLLPTRDLRGVAKGLLRDHLKLPEGAVAAAFPDSADAPALGGMLRGG